MPWEPSRATPWVGTDLRIEFWCRLFPPCYQMRTVSSQDMVLYRCAIGGGRLQESEADQTIPKTPRWGQTGETCNSGIIREDISSDDLTTQVCCLLYATPKMKKQRDKIVGNTQIRRGTFKGPAMPPWGCQAGKCPQRTPPRPVWPLCLSETIVPLNSALLELKATALKGGGLCRMLV